MSRCVKRFLASSNSGRESVDEEESSLGISGDILSSFLPSSTIIPDFLLPTLSRPFLVCQIISKTDPPSMFYNRFAGNVDIFVACRTNAYNSLSRRSCGGCGTRGGLTLQMPTTEEVLSRLLPVHGVKVVSQNDKAKGAYYLAADQVAVLQNAE